MKVRAAFTPFWIDVSGSRFQCRPLKVGQKFDLNQVITELADLGKGARFYQLSRDSQQRMIDVVCDCVVGWEGLTDEHGRQMTCEDPREQLAGAEPQDMLTMFFEIWKASELTEEQRKNLSTPSNRLAPAASSTASGATPGASTPATDPQSSDTTTAAGSA